MLAARIVLLVTIFTPLAACPIGSPGTPQQSEPNHASHPVPDDQPLADPPEDAGTGNASPPALGTIPDPLLPVEADSLRDVEGAVVWEPPHFDTALNIDASTYGLVGDEATESTAILRRLFAGGNRTVHIRAGEYVTDQLRIESRTVLILEPGVVIRDAGRLADGQALLHIQSADVRIEALGARVVGSPELYTIAGRRHGVSMHSARNILIQGLESVNFSGSGFQIHGDSRHPSRDVVLRGCHARGNRASGLHVASSERIRIIDCEFGRSAESSQQFGLEIRPIRSSDVTHDVIVARVHTLTNKAGGIVIDLQTFDSVSEPATVTIVEHLSTLEPVSIAAFMREDTRATLRYSHAYESNPRQAWRSVRQHLGAIVLSYYWPIEANEQVSYRLEMSTPNAIDILAAEVHGAPEIRTYWARRGKMLLNRVYPFKIRRTEQELYRYFAENMRAGIGISIDEVIAHRLEKPELQMLERVLARLRSEFPDKLIVVWDASHWDSRSASLLRAIRDHADAIALETYVSQREARTVGYGRFTRQLRLIERYAPGIISKALLGIGAYDRMRDVRTASFSDHLENQVRYIAESREACAIAGIGIYAPVYLTSEEQHRLDTAIRTHLQVGVRAACASAGGE